MEENKNIGMIIDEEDLDKVSGGMRPAVGSSDCPVCGSTDLDEPRSNRRKCKNCGYAFTVC